MLRWLVAATAAVAALAMARTAWRLPARERLRAHPRPTSDRLPAPVRRRLERALREASVTVTCEDALWIASTAIVVAGVLTAAIDLALVPVAVLVTAAAGPVGLVLARGRAQRVFVAALPDFVDLVAARLRSGHTVVSALAERGARDDPIASDRRRILARLDLGAPLAGALTAWSDERRLEVVRPVAASLAVATETGGAAAGALEGLARSLRDQLGARDEAAALSAQARMSAIVVGVAPIAFLVFSAAVDPATVTALLGSSTGRICLLFGVILDALGALWMRAIVRSEP